MKRNLIAAALFGAAISPFSALADDTMEIAIVTPTRVSQSPGQAIADTTVISAEDIRKSQAPDVPTLLKGVAGVEVAQAGGIGQQSSVFMRGTNSDHVLILVDGVRMDSATTGTTALDQLMLDQIDHIEVVRGNASSLYGSSAIGGVIQIFTKQGKGEPAFNASAGAGSHYTQRASAGFGGQAGGTGFNLQASRFKTDGVPAINPALVPTANPDKDGYDNTSLSANLRQAINADHSLSASVFQSHGNIRFDNPFNLAVTDVNTSVANLGKLSLAADDRFSETWQSKLQWSQGTDDFKTYLNGQPDLVNGYYYRTQDRQLSWQNNLTLNAANSVMLGAERLEQQVESDTLYTKTQRTANAVFGGYTGNFGAHQIQANLRQDRYSDFGAANTGLAGYGYSLDASWRVTASYSTAFKAPTFNDLYYPLSFGYQGNPLLQPERSHNAEAGVHYAHGGQHVDLVYFHNNIDNLIAINNAGTSVVNINRALIKGAELIYAGKFGGTGVKASLTSQSARDAVTDQPLLRRAHLYGSLGVDQQLGGWQVGGEWLYSSTRDDRYTDPLTFATSSQTLASYNVINLIAGYSLSKEWRLQLRADNVTNQNDSNIYGYNPLGRTLFASINYQQ